MAVTTARRTRSNRQASDTNTVTTKPAGRPQPTVVQTAPATPEPAGANSSIKQRAAKAPTQLHRDFAEWLQAQTGVQVDPKAVQLTISLLGDYQKSPERKATRVRAAEQREGALAERKTTLEKKAAERKAKLEKELATLKAKLGE